MDSGTFRYLLGIAIQYTLDTQLMDVVTAYFYGPLGAYIYIKLPLDFLADFPPKDVPSVYYGLHLQKALYRLKQVGCMWYQHLCKFLLHHHFSHDHALLCLFTLKNSSGFVVVAIYVDDLNLVGTRMTCKHVVELLIITNI